MSREFRIEMHCEDMGAAELMLSRGANECGFGTGRAQCNSANPATRTLDVRSGFQSSIRVPKLPFRHVLALALVVQVASDEYGRAFTLGIDIDRVDELPVMLHQDL